MMYALSRMDDIQYMRVLPYLIDSKSKQKKLREIADRELEEWIQMQKYILTEQKYLELLCNYDKYLKERQWQQMM